MTNDEYNRLATSSDPRIRGNGDGMGWGGVNPAYNQRMGLPGPLTLDQVNSAGGWRQALRGWLDQAGTPWAESQGYFRGQHGKTPDGWTGNFFASTPGIPRPTGTGGGSVPLSKLANPGVPYTGGGMGGSALGSGMRSGAPVSFGAQTDMGGVAGSGVDGTAGIGNGLRYAGGSPTFDETGGGMGAMGAGMRSGAPSAWGGAQQTEMGAPTMGGGSVGVGGGLGTVGTGPARGGTTTGGPLSGGGQQTEMGGGTGGGVMGTQGGGGANVGYGVNVNDYLDPSMLFQMTQGLGALQNSAAARGNLNSGQTLRDILNYSQGLASTNYNNAFNQASNVRNFNYGVDTGDRDFAYRTASDDWNRNYQPLRDLATMGLSGTQGAAGSDNALSALIASLMQNAGQIAGTGQIGQGNNVNSTISNILSQILGRGATVA